MAVIIFPVGGLGNQLFIYAAGKALAKKHGLRLKIDSSHYERNQDRRLELDSFASSWENVSGSYSVLHLLKLVLVRAYLRVKRLSRKLCFKGAWALDDAFLYKPVFLRFGGDYWLKGYFQSWRYFDAVEDELRNEISQGGHQTEFFSRAISEISKATVSVAVHVRRGDYVANSYMGILPEAYYERALSLMRSLVGDFKIFVFTDDPESISQESFLSTWAARMTILSASEASRPIETLRLIAKCDHVVTANSSFSWWGAWLGQRQDRYVIYPRPWLSGARVDDRDLALPSWISIGAE